MKVRNELEIETGSAGSSSGGDDVNLTVVVELGRSEMAARDVLGLSRGSIIQLQRIPADPVDILVDNRVVARGEVVVVGDCLGVRVTELIAGDAAPAAEEVRTGADAVRPAPTPEEVADATGPVK